MRKPDDTQSGSDIIVTSKDTPTEAEADKIKGAQAEQSAKIAHTTQAELDEILEDFYDGDIRQSNMGKAKYAILDWHNKQVKNAVATAEDDLDQYWNKELDKQTEEVLDRLCSDDKMYWDGAHVNYLVRKSAIAAERAKLKEVK